MPRVNRFTEAMKRLGEVSSCRQRKGVREKDLKYPGNAAERKTEPQDDEDPVFIFTLKLERSEE